MSDIETIMKFLNEMRTQDNRGTALPIYYVIRTEVEESAPMDNCDYTKYYWNERSWDSFKEVEAEIDSQIEESYPYAENPAEHSYRKNKAIEEIHEYGVRKRWDERNMFLTEQDAENHLKLNHYHYSHNAHTYVHHAWRAPQLKEFFEALFNHFEIHAPEEP